MDVPIFSTPIDFAETVLTAPRSIGSASLKVADGSVFGDPSPTQPVRITAERAQDSARIHLVATARAGNTLTVAPQQGMADIALASGDAVAVTASGAALSEIHDAILDVVGEINAGGGAGGGTSLPPQSGKAGAILTTDGAGLDWASAQVLRSYISTRWDWGIVPDTSMDLGTGATAGTDRTSLIASKLSALAGGNFCLVVEGGITAQVAIPGSRVEVRGAYPGSGFKRPPGSTGPVLRNASPVLGTRSGVAVLPTTGAAPVPVDLGGFAQSDLRIIGLTIHGGAAGIPNFGGSSPYGPQVGMLLLGIDGLTVADCTVYDASSYAILRANTRRYRGLRNHLRVPNPWQSQTGDGRDGDHADGPQYDTLIEGCTFAGGDDGATVQANDGQTTNLPCPFPMPGPQLYIKIINNTFDGSGSAVRLLSSDCRIDHVLVQGNQGYAGNQPFVIDTFNYAAEDGGTGSGKNPRPGLGNVGAVSFLDNNVQARVDGLGLGTYWLQSDFDRVAIRSDFRPYPGIVTPFVTVYRNSHGNVLDLDLRCTDDDAANVPRHLLRQDGFIGTVRGRVQLSRPGKTAVAVPAYYSTQGEVKNLALDIDAENTTRVVELAGTSKAETVILSGIHRGAGPGNGSLHLTASGTPVANYCHAGLIAILSKSGSAAMPAHEYPSSDPAYAYPAGGPDPSTTLLSGLLASWSMSDATGSTIADSSGNSRPLTNSAANVATTMMIAGSARPAIRLTGSNTLASAASILAPINGSAWSMSGWVQLDGTALAIPVGWGNGDGATNLVLFYFNAGKWYFQIGDGGNSGTGSAIADGSPTSPAFVYLQWSGSRASISLDGGALVPASGDSTITGNPASYPLLFGNDSRTAPGYPATGKVSRWMAHSRALTSAEIAYRAAGSDY